jgi:hypothetical protein
MCTHRFIHIEQSLDVQVMTQDVHWVLALQHVFEFEDIERRLTLGTLSSQGYMLIVVMLALLFTLIVLATITILGMRRRYRVGYIPLM